MSVENYGLCLDTNCKNDTLLTSPESVKNTVFDSSIVSCDACGSEIFRVSFSGKIHFEKTNLKENETRVYHCKKCLKNYCYNCTNADYVNFLKTFKYWWLGIKS